MADEQTPRGAGAAPEEEHAAPEEERVDVADIPSASSDAAPELPVAPETAQSTPAAPKKRGRPLGSRNRPKDPERPAVRRVSARSARTEPAPTEDERSDEGPVEQIAEAAAPKRRVSGKQPAQVAEAQSVSAPAETSRSASSTGYAESHLPTLDVRRMMQDYVSGMKNREREKRNAMLSRMLELSMAM